MPDASFSHVIYDASLYRTFRNNGNEFNFSHFLFSFWITFDYLMRFSPFFPPGLSASATSTSKELDGKRSTKTAGMVCVAPGLYLGNKQPGLTDRGGKVAI